jgi:hypothetical protein
MKLFTAGLFLMMSTCAAIAAEPRSSGAVPQPRPRLDPTRQAVVPTRVPDVKEEADPALVLDRLVVKDSPVFAERPPAVEDPKGEFTLKDGGRYLRRDAGPFRLEAGIWPSIDLFPDESRFKPTKVLIEFDFLRIKF